MESKPSPEADNTSDPVEPPIDIEGSNRALFKGIVYLIAAVCCGLAAWCSFNGLTNGALGFGIGALLAQAIAHFTGGPGTATADTGMVHRICRSCRCLTLVSKDAEICPVCKKKSS